MDEESSRLLDLVEKELRRQAPELILRTPQHEPNVRWVGDLGAVWIEPYLNGTFALAVQDERGKSDWGGRLQKRHLVDSVTPETVEAAVMEALAFLRPRR